MDFETFKKGILEAKSKTITEEKKQVKMPILVNYSSPHKDKRPGKHSASVLDSGRFCKVCEKPLYFPSYFSFKTRETIKTCSKKCAFAFRRMRYNKV